MRHVLSRLRFFAWAVAVYAVANPRTAWRMLTARFTHKDSGPETGLSGAGVVAPLRPPPPIIVASMANVLPRIDVNET